ncbi:MAG: prolyl oligopeptidase family serine peptidase [Candidatus Hydrothermia bacterium]|jgi:oligopeptidase B|nr:prolyl oligopeptidase family serine peptidase [Candidatus Hydrothermia bacterium]
MIPKPPKIPYIIEKHNDRIIDYYYWMRNREDPRLLNYIKEEKKFLNEISKNFKHIEEELYNEFLSRIEEEDTSYPFKYGNYYYFYKTFKGKPYKAYYRTNNLKEEMLIDFNEIAKNYNYFDVGNIKFDYEGNFLAFNYDTNGSENFKLFLKDIRKNEIKFIFEKTFYSFEWFEGYLFFTITDEILRPYKVLKLNPINLKIEEIFQENDKAFNIHLMKSKDEKFVFIILHSIDTTEVWVIDKNFNLKLFKKRKKGIRYFIEHKEGEFYILTNEFNKNFEIYKCPVDNFEKFEIFVKARDYIKIESFEIFKNFMAIYELDKEKAINTIEIIDFDNNNAHYIEFPDDVYYVEISDNYEYETNFLRIEYQTLIQPKTIYDYDIKSKNLILRKQVKINNFNKELYEMKRIFADDIPITIAYRKDLLRKDGNNVLWAYGYGAYGQSIPPYFKAEKLSILDRGIVYAIIHIRGGGERGEEWYEQGKLLNKKRTIYDFIKACEFLIENKWTSKGKIIIEGASAGGILVGGCINERPELFKTAIAHVPFVDVLNTMLDPSLPLTILEYDEWGNPEIEEFYYYIKSYSPYDNVKEQNYPNVLAICGFNDPRVRYWEPLKWIAKLREKNKSNNVIAIKFEEEAGHYIGEDRYKILRENAFIIAFALWTLNEN